jgi:hypothetical protein
LRLTPARGDCKLARVPTDIAFSNGASVKVIAGIDDVAHALTDGSRTLDTARFAGFRGEESVPGERVLVNLVAVAYATEIRGP